MDCLSNKVVQRLEPAQLESGVRVQHGKGIRWFTKSSEAFSSRYSRPKQQVRHQQAVCHASIWPLNIGQSKAQRAQQEFLDEIRQEAPSKEVVYTRGPLLWQNLTGNGKLKSAKKGGNVAYQDFKPDDRSLTNYGQLLGDALYATAQGTYQPVGKSTKTPVEIEATVEGGALHLLGKQIPLPIKGSGRTSLVYIDNDSKLVRIFDSQGSISVQIRESWLQKQLQ